MYIFDKCTYMCVLPDFFDSATLCISVDLGILLLTPFFEKKSRWKFNFVEWGSRFRVI